MVTCVQTQFKGSSREIQQQVKQTRTLNKLINVNARLKKSVAFKKKNKKTCKLVQHIVSFLLI